MPPVPETSVVSEDQKRRLVESAITARDHAYAPHSHFYVGAALLLADGRIIQGCNVENASYSLTQCAERTAACSAVASGYRSFLAVAVASVGGVMPCGACRQVLAEFGMNLIIITIDVIDGSQQTTTLAKLLPEAFSPSDIPNA
ncbi:MAG: cytidine deaminase [Planctomycetota bacterium]